MHFTFFSKKNQQLDRIKLELTSTGWTMDHDCYKGPVKPDGTPHLQQCIENNYSGFPAALGDAFREIWEAATEKHIPEQEIQSRLDAFSEWTQNYSAFKISKPIT